MLEHLLVDTLVAVTVVAPKPQVYDELSSVVKELPAVQVQDYGSTGVKSFNFQGIGTYHVDLQLDGTPIHQSFGGTVDLAQLMNSFKSIEVTNDGARAASLSVKSDWKNQVSLSYGSHNTVNALASWSNSGFGADFALRHSDGYRDNDKSNSGNLYLKYVKGKHSVNLLTFLTKEGLPGSLQFPSVEDYLALNNRLAYSFNSNKFHNSVQVTNNYSHYGNLEYPDTEIADFSHWVIYDKAYYEVSNKWLTFTPCVVEQFSVMSCNSETPLTRNELQFGGLLKASNKHHSLLIDISGYWLTDGVPTDITFKYYDGTSHPDIVKPQSRIEYAFNNAGFGVKALYKRSYRYPTLSDVYYYGSKDIDLESVDRTSLTATYSNNWFKVSVEGFYDWINNKMCYSFDNLRSDTENYIYKYSLDNLGDVHSYGITTTVGVYGKWFTATGTYTYNDQTALKDASIVPYVAKHTLAINARAIWNKFALNVSEYFRSETTSTNIDFSTNEYTKMPSYNLVDVSIEYNPTTKINLAVIGKNVLDKKYEVYYGYPMQGASITGKLTYRF